jgi:hypothetical protein
MRQCQQQEQGFQATARKTFPMTHRTIFIEFVGGPRDGERKMHPPEERPVLPLRMMNDGYAIVSGREEGATLVITYEYRAPRRPML